jgi:hypothetical protein
LKTIRRCVLLRYLFYLSSYPLLNVGGLGSDDGCYPHKASKREIPKLINAFEWV